MPVEGLIGVEAGGAEPAFYMGAAGLYWITGYDQYGDRKMERIYFNDQS